MSTIDKIALQAASTAFATEKLPDNWVEMTNEEQKVWLNDHRWTPFENDTTDELYALIDTHADTIKGVIIDTLKVLKERLIVAAIECELPSDFNELDLQSMLSME